MTDPKSIKKVVIAGGGTAGWMAAAAISKLIGKDLDICLVESDQIATVGVGEATIPALQIFHKLLGIKEPHFMAATQATFKLGIEFKNWKNEDHSYIHSFGSVGKDCWAAGFQHFWKKAYDLGVADDYGNYCLELEAAKQNKFSHLNNTDINYAYHLDAGLYAKYLRRFSEAFGVRRIEGRIVRVETHTENDFIKSLILESGEEIEGDLFIDCTGFIGLLIEKTLHTGYENWSHWLPSDSAVAVQTEAVEAPIPYTRSTAHRAGWQWRIPLQHRVGNGLVYCSQHMSDDEAKAELLASIAGTPITEPKIIKYRTGQRLKHWNKNCVALGLASGFIEPLESTSIHLIQRGILRLLFMFPSKGIDEAEVKEYNRQTKAEIEHIRDFIILHYHVTQRKDSRFWRYCATMDVPQTLKDRMELFKSNGRFYARDDELFGEFSWVQVMLGQGLMPNGYHPIVDLMSRSELESFIQSIRQPIDQALSVMPTHGDYLQRYCKAAVPN